MILFYRSKIIARIRDFFSERNILEVDTPSLIKYTVTDINILPFKVLGKNKMDGVNFWLSTSPEYHMKRLLSSDIGAIYQICRVFRDEEIGQYHNSEFTMLEWYQPFYNMFDMMEIIELLFDKVFNISVFDRESYQNIFIKYFCVDPFHTDIKELNLILKKINCSNFCNSNNTITEILNLIFVFGIEPYLGKLRPISVYNYPSNQALLSKINDDDHRICERFEIFFQGIELGNAFCELINANEQNKRFNLENRIRKKNGLPQQCIDFRLIKALKKKYMPNCSGVSLGLDRIIMIMLKEKNIKNILSFSFKDC
ncbi:elongation factor P--(R)-beta-lysine ligase [Buchnera aphidicola]|uniref:elongation factor P--(R)-beta-lysine ligase n=1 Tax=Buchnera aphidicola TaxID=9 RepID=UPI003464C34A